jgi:hypothetical protein
MTLRRVVLLNCIILARQCGAADDVLGPGESHRISLEFGLHDTADTVRQAVADVPK